MIDSLLEAIEQPTRNIQMTDEQCLAQSIGKGAHIAITKSGARVLLQRTENAIRAHIPMSLIASDFAQLPKQTSFVAAAMEEQETDIREIKSHLLEGVAIKDGGICVVCADYKGQY